MAATMAGPGDFGDCGNCRGCQENQPNQLAHMDSGGCLYIEIGHDLTDEEIETVSTEILSMFSEENLHPIELASLETVKNGRQRQKPKRFR